MTINIIKASSTYVSTAKKGNSKYWRIDVVEEGGLYYTRQEYWQETKDGSDSVHQFSAPKLVSAKNVGKKNETKPVDQAMSEMESTILRYRDKGYHLEGEDAPELILPMLAMEYSKRKEVGKVVWPMYGQPKLDGIRCLYGLKDGFYSRQGKSFLAEVVSHITPAVGDNYILDGELILPHPYSFQDTIRAVKKYREGLSLKLTYVIYDVFDRDNPNLPYIERLDILDRVFKKRQSPNIELSETQTLISEEDMLVYHAENIQRGYEGTMLRDPNSVYLVNHRSAGLLKYKDFVDDEFEITDVMAGTAKFANCAIFECKAPNGLLFNVTPEGTIEEKEAYLREKDSLIGKMLKVKYQNLSEDGIPRFPVGLSIRDKDIEG